MENLEKVIKSLQATAQDKNGAQSVSNKPQRQFQPSRNTGAGQNNTRRQFIRPFDANVQQPRQPVEPNPMYSLGHSILFLGTHNARTW